MLSPKIPITSKEFKYTPAAATDIRKTFARVRKQLETATRDKKEENK